MSTHIQLVEIKRYLRVIHDLDDELLTDLLVSAEDEAMRFMNRTSIPIGFDSDYSDIGGVPGSVFTAVACLVKADYEAKPDEQQRLREIAEIKLMPYREEMGI